MRKLLCLLPVLVVGLAVLPGTAAAGETPTAQQAAIALKAELPQAKLYMVGPRVTRIYGQPMAFGTTPIDSAESFRHRHAGVFGVAPDELDPQGLEHDAALTQPVMFDQELGDYKFTLVRYAQHKNGIPVFRSDLRLLMRNQADFPVVLAASSLRPLGDFVPGTAPAEINPATRAATGMESFTEPEIVIWAGVDDMVKEPALALAFIGQSGSPEAGDYEKWLFVADAATGMILYKENLIILTDVSGNVSGMASEGPKADYCSE
ncbi:MAG: hypothetical protein JSU68_02460, partial [Phycisphaerales bacterium]